MKEGMRREKGRREQVRICQPWWWELLPPGELHRADRERNPWDLVTETILETGEAPALPRFV